MKPQTLFVLVLVVGSAIWVASDAKKLGVRRGRLGGGVYDMPTSSWVLATLLIWIIGFPGYLIARGKYQALNAAEQSRLAYTGVGPATRGYAPMGSASHPGQFVFAAAATPAPAHVSPDGRWWWNGQQWLPMPPLQ